MVLTQEEIFSHTQFEIYSQVEIKSNFTLFYTYFTQWTYIIKNPNTGLIKIGKSKNPFGRILALSEIYNVRLEILGLIMFDVESNLHEKFQEFKSSVHLVEGVCQIAGGTEWFEPSQELLNFITTTFINGEIEEILLCLETPKYGPNIPKSKGGTLKPKINIVPVFINEPIQLTPEQIRILKFRMAPSTLRDCRYNKLVFERSKIRQNLYLDKLILGLCYCYHCFKLNDGTFNLTFLEILLSGGCRYRKDNRTQLKFMAPTKSDRNTEALVLANLFFDRLVRKEKKAFKHNVVWTARDDITLSLKTIGSLEHLLNGDELREVLALTEHYNNQLPSQIEITFPESECKTELLNMLVKAVLKLPES